MKPNMFILNSKFTHNTIKNNISKYNLIPYECSTCKNQGKHNGLSLTLQLDHINGNKNDNRFENRRYICATCHCATPTFAGRNRKKS